MAQLKVSIRQFVIWTAASSAVFVMMFPWVTVPVSPSCDCDSKVVAYAEVAENHQPSSCESEEVSKRECCSSKAVADTETTADRGCCCNPIAKQCRCFDCKCNASPKDPRQKTPVPTSQHNQLVFAGAPACFTMDLGDDGVSRLHFASTAFLSTHSSLQKCVLLSRFLC